jgi:hypothetical protein
VLRSYLVSVSVAVLLRVELDEQISDVLKSLPDSESLFCQFADVFLYEFLVLRIIHQGREGATLFVIADVSAMTGSESLVALQSTEPNAPT